MAQKWLSNNNTSYLSEKMKILSSKTSYHMGKNQALETMPETLKTTYPSTRCIIDCTKIFCKINHYCPSKVVLTQAINTMSHTKYCLL